MDAITGAISMAALFGIPVALIAWGVYAFRKWPGRWRYAALVPIVVLGADALLIVASGGYAAGFVVGLHVGGISFMYLLTEIRIARRIRDKIPRSR